MRHVIGLNLVLGAWLFVSPFAFGYDIASSTAMWNDVIVGLTIIACSGWVAADRLGQALGSACGILCGAWLIWAPFALKYRVDAFSIDVTIGALVLVISGIEAWRIVHRPANPT